MIGEITGRDLVGWGVPPGPWYKIAIEMANEMRRAGVGDDLIKDNLLAFAREQDDAREARLRELVVPTMVLPPPHRRWDLPLTAPFRVYGEHEEKTIRQMERCLSIGSAARGVLCADGHLGYAHPIGGVVAYEEHISISGVGFDIACGNMAVRLDVRYIDICDRAQQIADDINRAVSFGIGRVNNEQVEHSVLDDSDLWGAVEGAEKLRVKAAAQLGTVGSGNHYVDLFEDQEGYVWIGVHFGSRGLGHGITTEHLRLLGAKDGMEVDPALLPTEHDLGRSYIAGLNLAGQYAYAGREWVVDRVRRIIGGNITDMVHNHHNWAWWEYHDGRGYWVVRKGATPAHPGQRGFVGGSMGENAVILSGVDSPLSRESLYSTVHGAGRVMSRTEARGKLKKDAEGREVRLPGKVDPGAWKAWIEDVGVTLVGGEVDEAPQAYRRLPDVLAAHAGTIDVVHQLRPFVVVMASEGVRDPYKD